MISLCQYANCMEDIKENGVMISLKSETSDGDKKAGFCCAAHAAAALHKLAIDRGEIKSRTVYPLSEVPRTWKVR